MAKFGYLFESLIHGVSDRVCELGGNLLNILFVLCCLLFPVFTDSMLSLAVPDKFELPRRRH